MYLKRGEKKTNCEDKIRKGLIVLIRLPAMTDFFNHLILIILTEVVV